MLNLLPQPSLVEVGVGGFRLTSATPIHVDESLRGAAERLQETVRAGLGIDLAPADRASGGAAVGGSTTAGSISLAVDTSLGDEAYRVAVDADGIRIDAADVRGAHHAVQTLLQLLPARVHRRAAIAPDEPVTVPSVRIEDAPRYRWRGLMLDVARHFAPVAEVLRVINQLAMHRLTVLHLHLTDDQGWRIQIDARPRLTGAGSGGDATGGPGGFYTKDDYREIVAYAAARHMTVVPEIDLPGHTHAIGLGYPDLVEQPAISEANISEAAELHQPLPVHGEHYAGWGVGHSSVKIHDERTYDLIRDVLTELADLTPGPYLHIGGDECLGTSAADFALFFERVGRLAADTGKTPVAWHEAGAVDGLTPGMIGQYWGSAVPQGEHAAHARRFVERGGALILSPSDRAYLDMKPRADYPLGLAWAGIVPLRTSYDWDPGTVLDGVPAAAILGIEAPLWTESVTTIAEADSLAFPRIAAQAEIGWSAQNGSERSWESFRDRVARRIPGWEASGIVIDRAALDDENNPGPARADAAEPATASVPSIEETA